ncbi:MAG: NAD(P)/FAD-dependent oxidoreductase [Nitrospinae bacterium]|nr:NAD(P)/FAD-dependent oxidoreductase [Nitrospinota bacterium]
MNRYDVIVIGGGPAGSASAIFLSHFGYKVALLDQATFPRDKVCGEFISPAADVILERLGVLSAIEALSPVRLSGVAISSYEKAGFAVEYPPLPGTARPMTSLSLPRFVFDRLLMQRVEQAGVTVKEGHKVTDFIVEEGKIAGVRGRDDSKTPFEFRASVVVDAGGRNCVSLRRFDLKKKSRSSSKIALAAHWTTPHPLKKYCTMHISHPGYTGIAPTGENQVNVVLVVDKKSLQGENDLHDFYVRTVLQNPLRRNLLDKAQVAEKVRSVDSLAFSVRPPQIGGLVLVGDASGFIDPFTGEGIYLSLRSAQIAGEVIDASFKKNDFSREALAVYEHARKKEFNKKFLLSKIFQRLIYNPPLCNRVIQILADHPDQAATLVGVIGDYIPAEKVVSLRFLGRLLAKAWGTDSRILSGKEPDASPYL